ncbi:MAG TPA: HAD-IA family hydrolase [Solirubrobacteraceae bacterium]|nr:HAD-IA family hydrolase [Solirubrobacteraceae bacterium]
MRRRRGPSAAPPRRALLIDGLGTLVALQPPAPALARALIVRHGVEVSEAEAGRALAAEIAFYRAHMGAGRDADSLSALRHRCAEVLREALPSSERLSAVGPEAMTDTLLSALRFEPYPDVRPALIRARRRGAHVVVVSNWDVSLLEVLELAGLAPLLDGVVTSAAVGAAKPAPAVFEHGLALAGVPAAGALHVGDSLAEDVQGARECGIRAVLLARGEREAPAGVTVISGLHQLDWP